MCRNANGELVSGFTSKIFASYALDVEAPALCDALSLVVNLNLLCFLFEPGFMDLVEVCRGNSVRREIEHIVKDIQRMEICFTFVGVHVDQ